MGLPKKVKKDINVYPGSELLKRREELLNRIVDQDTTLPESILHEDLDFGMLEFVKEYLLFSTDNGNRVNFIERILTIQRWSEISNTFPFTDEDGNIELPFVVVIRKPEVPYGSNPSLQYTIPDRHAFFYRRIPTWDGNRLGADIYKIPQPIPVDMSFEVVVVCNRMRELNRFNKKVMQKFSSRQAYTTVKGHYIPLILESISDQSQIDTTEGRRYYQQTYSIQLQGFLIDEEEFEVTPAINRTLLVVEPADNIGRGVPVKIEKKIINNVEIISVLFLGDGITTTFKVQKKINSLFYVEVNGLIQREGIDYFHNGTSSNIIFTESPLFNSQIRVVYTNEDPLINEDGSQITLIREIIVSDGTQLTINVNNNINDIVILEVGGLIQTPQDYYSFVKDTTTININESPLLGTKIGVVYFSRLYLNAVSAESYDQYFDVITSYFNADGITTKYVLGRKIDSVSNISINGEVKELGVDYTFFVGDSYVTFITPPNDGDEIRIIYIYNINNVDVQGNIISVEKDTIIFDGISTTINTTRPILEIISLDINGHLQLEDDFYEYVPSTNTINIKGLNVAGAEITVTYTYKS